MLYQPEYEEGQGLVEYALLLAMIGTAVMAVMTLLSPAIGNIYANIVYSISDANGGA
ncbi:MAG: Flp family type IVb pilin [Aggregatilineales bacterium]